MATGIPYERVLDVASVTKKGYRVHPSMPGTYSALAVLCALGFDAVRSMRFDCIEAGAPPAYVVWGRRAILAVPSLNGFKGWHDVYWDGAHLLDPSPKATYPDTLDGLTMLGWTIFDERATASPAEPLLTSGKT
jgi:hypothetical protein